MWSFLQRLYARSRYRHFARDLTEELAFHRAMKERELATTGIGADPRAGASRALGNTTLMAEEARAIWRVVWADDFAKDVRYALRSLAKAPWVTATAVLTLAFGIAAVSSVFSVVNSFLYRDLPYPDADRIVAVTAYPESHGVWIWGEAPLPIVEQIRLSGVFERVAAFYEHFYALDRPEGSLQVYATAIDSSVLALLQVRPERGRLFTADEIHARAPVALISDSLWRSAYGADETIIGRSAVLDGTHYSIVGILPRGYRFYQRSDMLIPLEERPDSVDVPAAQRYGLLGKLPAGVSLASARAEVGQLQRRLADGDPTLRGWRIDVENGMYDRARGFGPLFAWGFIGVVSFVLLVACTNVANLLLIRAAERRREMAIRVTLGAARSRLVRLLLTESLLLGFAAGALAALLTLWGADLLFAVIANPGTPTWARGGVDLHVFAFALGLTFLVIITVGLTPALEGSRLDPVSALKTGGDGMAGGRPVTGSARRGVALEIALSLALTIGSLLLWRSYQATTTASLGYPADRLAMPFITLDRARYPDDNSRLAFFHTLTERLGGDPGVGGTAIRGTATVLNVDAPARTAALRAPGGSAAAATDWGGLHLAEDPTALALPPQYHLDSWSVSDSVFSLMNLPIARGRGFDAQDQLGAMPVAIVSQTLASRLWHGGDVLGRTFTIGRRGTPVTVIGVVGDYRAAVRDGPATQVEAIPALYYSERQMTPINIRPMVRARGDAAVVIQLLPQVLHEIDPGAVIGGNTTMAEQATRGRLTLSLLGTVLGVCAFGTLLLATIGTYGIVAYGVLLRAREIGVRIALGGTPRQIVLGFVRDGLGAVGIGLAIGLLIALGASRGLASLLVGVSPLDPLTYILTCVLFVAAGLLACWIRPVAPPSWTQ